MQAVVHKPHGIKGSEGTGEMMGGHLPWTTQVEAAGICDATAGWRGMACMRSEVRGGRFFVCRTQVLQEEPSSLLLYFTLKLKFVTAPFCQEMCLKPKANQIRNF